MSKFVCTIMLDLRDILKRTSALHLAMEWTDCTSSLYCKATSTILQWTSRDKQAPEFGQN